MKKIIIALLLMLPNVVMALPTIKFTLLVVDEQGVAIEGADARIGLMKPRSDAWGGKTSFVAGKTDKNGLFTGQGETQQYATYSASADGYYGSGIKYNGFTGVSGMIGFRKWQPWNPTLKVVLRKIKKPIAMYAHRTTLITIPKHNEIIGYDLVKHDWVSPYGKGITKDFLFKLEYLPGEKDSNDRYFTMSFSNEADGIQSFESKESNGSSFRSAYHAPISGYRNAIKQSRVWKKGRPVSSYNEGDGTNYYFRVRCDGDKPESCLYGKVYGNIEFGNQEVRFTYFLNPSIDDTNVEFDPKKNLFEDDRSVFMP
jgi:hypothetical protein